MLNIISNGSKWAGEEPDSINELLSLLRREPLDPSFEAYGNFVHPALRARVEYDGCNTVYVDGDPIYPDAPDAVRFFGNFFTTSHAFTIDTDEPAIIETLTAAIRANQATDVYVSAKR